MKWITVFCHKSKALDRFQPPSKFHRNCNLKFMNNRRCLASNMMELFKLKIRWLHSCRCRSSPHWMLIGWKCGKSVNSCDNPWDGATLPFQFQYFHLCLTGYCCCCYNIPGSGYIGDIEAVGSRLNGRMEIITLLNHSFDYIAITSKLKITSHS